MIAAQAVHRIEDQLIAFHRNTHLLRSSDTHKPAHVLIHVQRIGEEKRGFLFAFGVGGGGDQYEITDGGYGKGERSLIFRTDAVAIPTDLHLARRFAAQHTVHGEAVVEAVGFMLPCKGERAALLRGREAAFEVLSGRIIAGLHRHDQALVGEVRGRERLHVADARIDALANGGDLELEGLQSTGYRDQLTEVECNGVGLLLFQALIGLKGQGLLIMPAHHTFHVRGEVE